MSVPRNRIRQATERNYNKKLWLAIIAHFLIFPAGLGLLWLANEIKRWRVVDQRTFEATKNYPFWSDLSFFSGIFLLLGNTIAMHKGWLMPNYTSERMLQSERELMSLSAALKGSEEETKIRTEQESQSQFVEQYNSEHPPSSSVPLLSDTNTQPTHNPEGILYMMSNERKKDDKKHKNSNANDSAPTMNNSNASSSSSFSPTSSRRDKSLH